MDCAPVWSWQYISLNLEREPLLSFDEAQDERS